MSIPFNPITISIGKKSLSSFISLQIEQNIGKHHRFQMSVELESGGNRYVHNISENSKKWLGESIVVKAANTPIFVGVVTNVQLHREGSDFGCIMFLATPLLTEWKRHIAASHGMIEPLGMS